MILGSSIRVGCDRPGCPEVGSINLPADWDATKSSHKDIQKLAHANGWYMTPGETFCYRHKPKDWDGPAHVALPPEMLGRKT